MLPTVGLIGMSLLQIKCANDYLSWDSTSRIFLKGGNPGLSDGFQLQEEKRNLEEQTVKIRGRYSEKAHRSL